MRCEMWLKALKKANNSYFLNKCHAYLLKLNYNTSTKHNFLSKRDMARSCSAADFLDRHRLKISPARL